MNIRIIFFLALLISVSISSCGEDDEMMTTNTTETVGAWKATSLTGNVDITYVLDGNSTLSSTILEGRNLDYILNMTDNGFSTSGDYNINFTITVEPNTVMNLDTYTNIIESGTYNTSGNVMNIDGELFDIVLNGLPVTLGSEPNGANYSISNSIMTITQTGVVTKTETTGLESTSDISIVSTWEKQ